MVVEIRLYKIYDADLISLAAAGYSISSMMRDAICAYANGRPLHYYIDEPTNIDFNNMKSMHTRFVIPNEDAKAVYLVKNIKHRCRNMFCKAVLRDALIQQNLSVFFASEAQEYLLPLVGINGSNRNAGSFQNTIPVSSLKSENKQVSFGGKTIEVSAPEINPFATQQKVAQFVNMMPAAAAAPIPIVQPVVPQTVSYSSAPINVSLQEPKELPKEEQPMAKSAAYVLPDAESKETFAPTTESSENIIEEADEEMNEAADKLMKLMGDF